MTDIAFGADFKTWMFFAEQLKLRADLLPVVSDPRVPISPMSKMKGLGKTPSRINGEGQAVGIPQWTQVSADVRDISRWSKDKRLGICLQTRLVRAIDIDVPDLDKAKEIEQAVRDAVPGVNFPLRYRDGTGKRLLAFSYAGDLFKRQVPVDGGIVELLATGQQFVAAGTHTSGTRYQWVGGLPDAFPVLDEHEVETIWSAIELCFATGDSTRASSRRERTLTTGEGVAPDDVTQYLLANSLVLDESASGQVYVECPWASGHTMDSGVTESGWFPARSGGFDQGHYVCLHASCQGRTDEEFLDAIGYNADTEFRSRDFPDLEDGRSIVPAVPGLEDARGGVPARNLAGRLPTVPADIAPVFKRDKQSAIIVTQENVGKAVECAPFITRKLRWDTFTAETVWSWWDEADNGELWTPWGDVDNTRLLRTLDRRGFKSTPGIEMIRRAVHEVSHQQPVDTAINWLNNQSWDGQERVETFLIDYLGAADTPYIRAVGRYMWTAMAARALVPGIQADMAVILVTEEQGRGKTSMIRALVPFEEWFGELDLAKNDDDLGRLMKGKLVCELPELKGLATRELESIKAFISRRKDEWVPKYFEKAQPFLRRVFMVGTTNDTEFLADPTGERRWLPLVIGKADIAAIKRDCRQLWAEARERFDLLGVEWQDAEELARAEHSKFKARDPLEDTVRAWAEGEEVGGGTPAERGFTLEELCNQCFDIKITSVRVGEQRRYGKMLRSMGYRPRDTRRGGVPVRVWQMEKTDE